jgi:hypothetical protein
MPQSSPYQSHRRRMAGAGARISRASAASPDGCQSPERLQHAATGRHLSASDEERPCPDTADTVGNEPTGTWARIAKSSRVNRRSN